MPPKAFLGSNYSILVKFVGGPFDGHEQQIPFAPDNGPFALPIAQNIFRMMNGERRKTPELVKKVAMYRFDGEKCVFASIERAEAVNLHEWRV